MRCRASTLLAIGLSSFGISRKFICVAQSCTHGFRVATKTKANSNDEVRMTKQEGAIEARMPKKRSILRLDSLVPSFLRHSSLELHHSNHSSFGPRHFFTSSHLNGKRARNIYR